MYRSTHQWRGARLVLEVRHRVEPLALEERLEDARRVGVAHNVAHNYRH